MANSPRKSPQAEMDVASIWQFIANNNVRAADAMLDRIEAAFDLLAQAPLAGRERNDLGANLRSFPVESYIVFYTPVSDGIDVVRVMSGRRDISSDDVT
jgi:toxin ParE1/3/4